MQYIIIVFNGLKKSWLKIVRIKLKTHLCYIFLDASFDSNYIVTFTSNSAVESSNNIDGVDCVWWGNVTTGYFMAGSMCK